MAFPAFILAMGITAALGNSVGNVVIAMAMTQIPDYLRLIRGEMFRVRETGICRSRAGRSATRHGAIILIHLLPNCLPPIIVQATLAMGYALLTMAALSFIGLGIQPPQSEWGSMTAEGATYIVTGEWWLFLFPGLAIVVTVLAFNLVGDALRDILDPRMRGRDERPARGRGPVGRVRHRRWRGRGGRRGELRSAPARSSGWSANRARASR